MLTDLWILVENPLQIDEKRWLLGLSAAFSATSKVDPQIDHPAESDSASRKQTYSIKTTELHTSEHIVCL